MPHTPIDVLIIDDCARDREVIRTFLLAEGDQKYRVREARNRAEGAQLFAERKPDCVLLDFRLPDADGLHILREHAQKDFPSRCPMVLMTGSDDARLSEEALVQGAQDFLAKRDLTGGLLKRIIEHAMLRFRLEEERLGAMERLADRESLLRMAQEIGGIGTFEWELAEGRTRFGGAYFELYGFPGTSPPFTYQQWLERIHSDDRAGIQQETERMLDAGREFSYDYRVVWPDGTIHWLLARGAVVRDSSGRAARLTGVNIDITAVKSAEEALVAANMELQEFAFTAGHDLQAPLRTIGVFADLLEKTLGASADQNIQRAVSQVRSGSRRMGMLVGDLLAYAHSSSRSDTSVNLPLQQILDRALENLTSDIEAGGAKITWNEFPLSACFGVSFVQVLQNLICNAIRYARNGVSPEIHVSCTQNAKQWVIAIQDNGRGFDMAHRELIFEPFKRLGGHDTAGTGLGLSICRRIIERRGGQIWAESNEGAGTTFFVSAPVCECGELPKETSESNYNRTVAV